MSTLIPGSEPEPTSEIDYHAAEGLNDAPPVEHPIGAPADDDGKRWREWMMVGVGLTALVAILAIMVSAFALATAAGTSSSTERPQR